MSAIKYMPGWPERLAAYIEQRRHMPFAWGDNDCVTFAAGGVAVLTQTPLKQLLPAMTWASARGAARALKVAGGVRAAASGVLGPPVTGPAAAMLCRGAVVCVDAGNGPTLGLMTGGGRWCAPGERGLVWRPAAEVRVGWGV